MGLVLRYSRQGAEHAEVFWARTNHTLKFFAALAPLREKKTNIISRRRRVRRGVWINNKTNKEVLGDLGAFEREKTINLAKAQSTQRCLG